MPKVPLTSEERVELILSLAEQAGKQARGESPAALQELLRQTPEEILADPDLRMALRLHEVEPESLIPEKELVHPEVLLEPAVDKVYISLSPEQAAESAYDLEQVLPEGTTPIDHLARFDPARANLSEVTAEEAERYLQENQDERPWLKAALGSASEVKQVFVSLRAKSNRSRHLAPRLRLGSFCSILLVDQGHGHALARHEGYADDEMQSRRVRYLEDPAQLDPVKRAQGIDGIKAGGKPHVCAEYATRINDAGAFAVAFVRGLEHPDVNKALAARYQWDACPSEVSIPIEDLLGPTGHRSCSGYRLVGDDPGHARRDRAAWLAAQADTMPAAVAEPAAERIQSMEGWLVAFRFRPNNSRTAYEVSTMFISPPDEIAN